jgi:S1-C subfamily serine protease
VGGAVVDARGGVVGLATPRFAGFGAIAVPASSIHKTTDVLLQKGHIPRGYLGVGLQPVRLPDALREKLKWNEKTAAIVMDVHPDGPADKSGIVIGDIFISISGHAVTRLEDIQAQLAGDAIGKTLPLKYIRGGTIHDGSIVVAERPHGGE